MNIRSVNTFIPVRNNALNFSSSIKNSSKKITLPKESFSSVEFAQELTPKSMPKENEQPKAVSHQDNNQKPSSDYHFKPPFKVYQESSGQWMMELPNAKVPVQSKPKWLEGIEQMNNILDQSENPQQLRKYTDDIKGIADSSYNSQSKNMDVGKINEYIGGIDNSKMIDDLTNIYQLKLDNETDSTNQIGGALAGSRCSEMAKYGTIMDSLKAKRSQMG